MLSLSLPLSSLDDAKLNYITLGSTVLRGITLNSVWCVQVFFWVSGRRADMTRVKSLSLADNQTLVSDLRMYTDYAFVLAAFGSGGVGPNSSAPVVAKTLDGRKSNL